MSFKITRKTVRFILNIVILKNFVFLSYSDANFFFIPGKLLLLVTNEVRK
jgi:hypothetical protein